MKKSYIPLLCTAALSFVFASCASKTKTPEEAEEKVQEAVEETEEITETVEEVAGETATVEDVENARAAAKEAGADNYAADQMAACDAAYKLLKAQADAGQNVGAALADLQKRYQALTAYSNAVKTKNRVDELNLAGYDQTSYDSGCAALESFKDISSVKDALASTMQEKADTAYASFKNVLQAGFKVLAKQERSKAFAAKQQCDGIKAGVASKDAYNTAVTEFRSGDSSYGMQNPEAAYNHWIAATAQFTDIYNVVSEKRAAALKAMEEAKAKVEESQTYAQTADVEVPLTEENVQGIEAADAVLLEEDKYEAPETQVADIPEEIKDEVVEVEAE